MHHNNNSTLCMMLEDMTCFAEDMQKAMLQSV